MKRTAEMFSCEEIVAATGGRLSGIGGCGVTGVSTDSRTIGPGELFVALRGERFDGHDYLNAVASLGVKVALADNTWLAEHAPPDVLTCIGVEDTLRALGDLAAFHRRRFEIPVCAITGSNGKTTVKEMLAAILAQKAGGVKTEGNLNNLVGLPQMMFRLKSEHAWGVFEMGMSERGEIDRLAEIAAPIVGVVTNVFPAHLESMGSLEAIARAKGELFMRLEAGSTAVCNNDDLMVCALPVRAGVRKVSFGLHGADVTATRIENLGHAGQKFYLHLPGSEKPITLRAFGRHNIQNALAAAAAATAMGMLPDEIAQGLESFSPVEKRFCLEELDGVTLIDDSYNANPGSMAAGLVTLSELKGDGRSIAVLGDMLELGGGAIESHLGVGRLAATCVSKLYLMGRFAETVKAGAVEGGMVEDAILVAESPEPLLVDLRGTLQAGDCVLVKGSRGMKMERVAEGIRTWCATGSLKGGR